MIWPTSPSLSDQVGAFSLKGHAVDDRCFYRQSGGAGAVLVTLVLQSLSHDCSSRTCVVGAIVHSACTSSPAPRSNAASAAGCLVTSLIPIVFLNIVCMLHLVFGSAYVITHQCETSCSFRYYTWACEMHNSNSSRDKVSTLTTATQELYVPG